MILSYMNHFMGDDTFVVLAGYVWTIQKNEAKKWEWLGVLANVDKAMPLIFLDTMFPYGFIELEELFEISGKKHYRYEDVYSYQNIHNTQGLHLASGRIGKIIGSFYEIMCSKGRGHIDEGDDEWKEHGRNQVKSVELEKRLAF